MKKSSHCHTIHIQPFLPVPIFWQKSAKNDVFSDPCYGGSNVIFDQNRHIPQILYIKLHLKMPGNDQLQISPPPNYNHHHQADEKDN